ncbi:hypothetical protein AB6A40_005647 [Gnathostoma spinigerum]|uniref:G-protein coupled receptors family 1 profile domain-containing protein n=1 Tax=Gnathostoma spinigerum TaxID=75299 RepID=A0ABD6EG25_9BILA
MFVLVFVLSFCRLITAISGQEPSLCCKIFFCVTFMLWSVSFVAHVSPLLSLNFSADDASWVLNAYNRTMISDISLKSVYYVAWIMSCLALLDYALITIYCIVKRFQSSNNVRITAVEFFGLLQSSINVSFMLLLKIVCKVRPQNPIVNKYQSMVIGVLSIILAALNPLLQICISRKLRRGMLALLKKIRQFVTSLCQIQTKLVKVHTVPTLPQLIVEKKKSLTKQKNGCDLTTTTKISFICSRDPVISVTEYKPNPPRTRND